jgi:hypothetical protein
MPTATNKPKKSTALLEAARTAAESLAKIDLPARCALLGLPEPQADGALNLKMLGQSIALAAPEFDGYVLSSGRRVHPVDRLLILHYLLCDVPVAPSGHWITFRQFPCGHFYWEPFRLRTAEPLVRQIGNDLDLLRSRLSRFDWTPMAYGDLAARIHMLGKVEVALVYHCGDDELPAEANVLFDSCLRRLYGPEDAAAVAGRVCLGLCHRKCEPCFDCGLCDSP